MDQFSYVVSGEGRVGIGDEFAAVKDQTAYRVPATVEHEIRNTHTGPLIYVEIEVPSAVPVNLKDWIETVFPSLRSTGS